MRRPPLAAVLAVVLALLPLTGAAQPRTELPGWRVIDTSKPYPDLLAAVERATADAGMAVVTRAGPTEAAAGRGVTIPGNQVIGVFNNDFAVRILDLSLAAMIEAPIRFYVTEDPDGSATLSWKTPGHVFAPYAAEGGAPLEAIAGELDARFDSIAAAATAE